MKLMKLSKGKGTIILFAVTDIMVGDAGVYSYHIIDEKKKIDSLTIEQIREYTFECFVKDAEVQQNNK